MREGGGEGGVGRRGEEEVLIFLTHEPTPVPNNRDDTLVSTLSERLWPPGRI